MPPLYQLVLKISCATRCNFGYTTGTVSIVLPIAISNNAVNVSLVMTPLSSKMLEKMIMISALVCSSQPMIDASPGPHFKILPAMCVPISLPDSDTASSTAAATNTAEPPTPQL